MIESTSFGERLKAARTQAGLSQYDLEEKSGVKQSIISRLERGILKKSTDIVSLANACNVSVYWLQTGQGEKNSVMRLSNFEELDRAVEKFGLTDEEICKVRKHALEFATQLFLNK